ncbi:MAG: hypothetical protein AB8H86_22615 [Polyangiales bacterium]
MRRLLSLSFFVAACAGQSALNPAAEIHGGMDPSDAVDSALASFQAQGFVLDTREDAEGFAAFGAHHPDGRTVVRVASERGWVLAVTAPSEAHSRSWVRLAPGTLDSDGNGHLELLVTAPDVVRGVTCASMVEVVDGGAVERHVDFAAYGGEGCLVGRATEGPPRLVAQLFYPDLSRGVVPQIRVTLGRGLRVEQAVSIAPAGGDVPALLWARAVEAAATRFVLGEDVAVQIQAFEDLCECDTLPGECAAMRAHIEAGWAADAAE